ncbi:MAG TPA: hypothetical protein VFO62_06160 [Candidatus Binatia bacterium]|nr:hypothetical protein [Candidatus Binatia bacterium]
MTPPDTTEDRRVVAPTATGTLTTNAAFHFDVRPGAELTASSLAQVRALFRASYRAPNDSYLDRSLARLRYVATAWQDEELAGFAVAEPRRMDLPRLPRQIVALAGICCVDARFRRQGLFRELEVHAFRAGGVPAGERLLSCGRMAHPASFRTMSWSPSCVPARGRRPTPWQQEVGIAIAHAYGVERFDPETFVCAGSGTPMLPIIDVDVQAEEWEPFAQVDATRGDCLLGMLWTPAAPDDWSDPGR